MCEPNGMPVRYKTPVRLTLTVAVTATLCLSSLPSAIADKGDRAFPSKDEVAAAEERAEDKARDVSAIQASLLMANRTLELAEIAADQAWESYNGAMWRLALAKKELRDAEAEAHRARATVEEQRDAIGNLVATSYQQGAELTALAAMAGADGPEGVLDQYAAFQGASSAMDADYQRFTASGVLAEVFERQAQEARDRQAKLAEEASSARDAALGAAASAESTATLIAGENERLIWELAAAQNISVELAQQRQGALEEIARRREAARARAEAEAAIEALAAANRAAAAKARAEAQERADRREGRRREREQEKQDNDDSQDGDPPPAPPPPPPPPSLPPPASHGNGAIRSAIAFATAQIGEPYLWGATGPSSWDCSGLMLRAWESAGVYVPRVSRDQYAASVPVSLGDLRAGDMLFWGDSPSAIHHVAMYLGDGLMIHAPKTGDLVTIASMYGYMPDFFGRV